MPSNGSKHYKRPESVLVVVYTETGDALLLLRKHPPDFWQSVTGSLEWGENAAAAARRELAEETGIGDVEIVDRCTSRRFRIRPDWASRFRPGVTENLEHLYSVELPEPIPVHLNPEEHTELLWLPRDSAARRVGSWTNREAILAIVPAP